MTAKARAKLPETAAAGETVTVRTLIRHRMESGHRRDAAGELVPRDIVNRFTATFNGETVFSAELGTGIAANPYLEFTTRIDEPGTFRFAWTDDAGERVEIEREIALRD